MSKTSKIEWTDATWNPVSGCTKIPGAHGGISGCDKCYAATLAERFRGTSGHYYEHGFDVTLRPDMLKAPLRWTKPRRVFVNSMSDLFHVDVPDSYIERVFDIMLLARQHTFQLLTKRPERMRRFLDSYYPLTGVSSSVATPFSNVWLGVSLATKDDAWRVDMLRETRAALRFLSVEPMLGPVDNVGLDAIQWVICGGESGHGARPMELSWARDLRDRCKNASIPFFFKQVGLIRAGRGKGGDDASIPADLRVREFPSSLQLALTGAE
ncbi:MAG: DUF5131 family protein [Vulcanimicrobiaceae bacterium]